MNKRLKEIEMRLHAIKQEMGQDGADLAVLDQETDGLIAERAKIIEQVEQRKSLLNKIGSGGMGEGEPVVTEPESRALGVESKEYRAAFLKKVRGIELTETEKRAFTSAAASAGAAIPTQTANEIIKKLKQLAPLLDEITLLHVAGNVTFAVEGTKADADKHTENAELTASADTLTSVTLSSYEICKLVQVSKTVATMSIDAFETWLTDMISEKVAEKIGGYLVSGTGSSQPTGVEKAQTWGASNSVTVVKAASTTAANVQALIGLLPGMYDKNAKFLMSKKTLFTEFMALQDDSKNKIVTVEGHQYYIYGYPVMLDDNIAIGEAYLGDFKKIIGNLSEAINIVSGFDINTNSFKYLGCAMFDSKIALGEAFVKLVKAAA